MDIALQLSNTAVFAKVGQRRSSFVDLFVQLRNSFTDLLDLESVLLYFRLKAGDGVGAILKPFSAFISYVPEFWSGETTCYKERDTRRSICLFELSSLSALLLSS